MNPIIKYERYPVGVVILSNLVSFGIYTLGLLIMGRVGLLFALLFLLFILLFEFRLIRYHCVNCYYWGKRCGFGKGKVSAWLFQRGDPAKFCKKDMTWKDMIPDLLISLIPFIADIALLIVKFNVLVLTALLLLLFLSTAGNGYIRGKLTCKYCKQAELGCPADALFNAKKSIEKTPT